MFLFSTGRFLICNLSLNDKKQIIRWFSNNNPTLSGAHASSVNWTRPSGNTSWFYGQSSVCGEKFLRSRFPPGPSLLYLSFMFFYASEVLLVEVKLGLARIHVWIFGAFLLQNPPESHRSAQERSHRGAGGTDKAKMNFNSKGSQFLYFLYFTVEKSFSIIIDYVTCILSVRQIKAT